MTSAYSATAMLRAALEPLCTRHFSADLARAYSYIDRLCLHLCFHIAQECQLPRRSPETLADLAARIGLGPEAAYLLTAILDILAEEGFATWTEDGWVACRPCPPDGSAELQRAARMACPEALATFELIERCHDHAVAFIGGHEPGMAAIFPRGDLGLWERIHTADAVMSLYADLIPPALEVILGQGAHVLEVGAGVGAVAQRCLPLLRRRDTREYWFTDLGKLFVQRAQDRYGHKAWMRFATVDLDRSLSDQGFGPGSVDVVIAVNVLHVARDLVFTLRELHAALRAPGWLLCAEGSPPDHRRRWRLCLIYAFLHGWWDVSLDATMRPRPGFLLPSEWTTALRACGFDRVQTLPGEEWFDGPCRGGLIIAAKGVT